MTSVAPETGFIEASDGVRSSYSGTGPAQLVENGGFR